VLTDPVGCRKGNRECSYALVVTFRPDRVQTKVAGKADRAIMPKKQDDEELELRGSAGNSPREEEAESTLSIDELGLSCEALEEEKEEEEEEEEEAVLNSAAAKWQTIHPKTPPPSMTTDTFLQPIRWTPPREILGSVHTPQRSREPVEGQVMVSEERLEILELEIGGDFEERETSRAAAQLTVKTSPPHISPDSMAGKTILQPIRWTPARKALEFSTEEEGYYRYLGAKNILEGSGGIKHESTSPVKAVLSPIRWSYKSTAEK